MLGLAAIHALLEHGVSGIAIFDVPASFSTSQTRIDELTAKFPNARIITQVVDICDEAAVIAGVDATAKALGSVDHLLCFAGIVGAQQALEIGLADWKKVLDVNTTGSWICAQAVAKCVVEYSGER